jgi:hypothetical protein
MYLSGGDGAGGETTRSAASSRMTGEGQRYDGPAFWRIPRRHLEAPGVKKMFLCQYPVQLFGHIFHLCWPTTSGKPSENHNFPKQPIIPFPMKQLLPLLLLLCVCPLQAQNPPDPSLRKPYRVVVQNGIALQWFDTQFKSFALSVERPLNLYNHFGFQANFFFANEADGYSYRGISDKTWELGVFSKSFFHGRLTGRRSKAYIGPDMRFGFRYYNTYDPFDGSLEVLKSSTVKLMARLGWQYHMGPAVLEFALPIGFEVEKFKNARRYSSFYYYQDDNTWFVAAPALMLGIGF